MASLDGYERASRLSYFLWSSMPDDALMDARAPAGCNPPTGWPPRSGGCWPIPGRRRWSATSRASGWGRASWAVEQITLSDVTFDDDLRGAMATEATMFLGEMLTGGHAVKELIGAPFAFANARLAAHYGLPGAASLGTAFTKITPNRTH